MFKAIQEPRHFSIYTTNVHYHNALSLALSLTEILSAFNESDWFMEGLMIDGD